MRASAPSIAPSLQRSQSRPSQGRAAVKRPVPKPYHANERKPAISPTRATKAGGKMSKAADSAHRPTKTPAASKAAGPPCQRSDRTRVGAGEAELGDELARRRLDQGSDRKRHEAGRDGEDQAETEQDGAAEKPHASSLIA